MNIRGQINWLQLLVIIIAGGLAGLVAFLEFVASNQVEISKLIGPFLTSVVVSGVATALSMFSGKPLKEIANDIAESATGQDIDNDGK